MSVTAAKGFAAAGVHCGLRKNGKPDLALVRSTVPSVGAALFTANRVQAAQRTPRSRRRAISSRSKCKVLLLVLAARLAEWPAHVDRNRAVGRDCVGFLELL